MAKRVKATHTLGEILDFAETRGMKRDDAYQELISLLLDNNFGSSTARIRAIMAAM